MKKLSTVRVGETESVENAIKRFEAHKTQKYDFMLTSGEDMSKYVKHPILLKHKELLSNWVQERIFGVFYNTDFWIQECCDNYFDHQLTKEDCLELSEMFKEIALNINNEKGE